LFAAAKFLVEATKKSLVFPNFVAVTKAFFSVCGVKYMIFKLTYVTLRITFFSTTLDMLHCIRTQPALRKVAYSLNTRLASERDF